MRLVISLEKELNRQNGGFILQEKVESNAECVVYNNETHEVHDFETFSMVGLDPEEDVIRCFTNGNPRMMYRSIQLLIKQFEKVMQELPEEEQREVRKDIMMFKTLSDDWGADVDF